MVMLYHFICGLSTRAIVELELVIKNLKSVQGQNETKEISFVIYVFMLKDISVA